MNSVLSLRRWYKSESASLLYGGFKSAIRNVTRFSFQSADRCEVKDFLREECVSIDVRLLKCTRICRNPRDNGSRIWPPFLLWPAYYRSTQVRAALALNQTLYYNMNCIRVCQYAANLPRPRFDRALECVSGGGARAGHAAAKLTARLEAMQAGGRSPHVNVVSFNLNAHGMGDSCMPMCVVLQFLMRQTCFAHTLLCLYLPLQSGAATWPSPPRTCA
jgi:hypothetical protein